MAELLKSIAEPKSRYLVFTSAGRNANVANWVKHDDGFDLWVCCYEDIQPEYINDCDYFVRRKGGKFPNFKYCFDAWIEIFQRYEAVLISDDDIVIHGGRVSGLFEIRSRYDLWLMQPAFERTGKVSFRLNEVAPFSELRFCNFVEVTCPIFRLDKITEFMGIYDSRLVGWGVDLWYSQVLSAKDVERNKIAIVDSVSCVNPREVGKIDGKREIDALQSADVRQEIWEQLQDEYSLDRSFQRTQWGRVRAAFSIKVMLRSLRILLIRLSYRLYKALVREKWRPE
ncbi:hypothetical protein N9H37_01475 [Congregibacter sp.]|nr:hypothetical protein [Congregibacter sp.]MDA8962010.1 hypothetical protein [Congregibacter sp.]